MHVIVKDGVEKDGVEHGTGLNTRDWIAFDMCAKWGGAVRGGGAVSIIN